MAFVGYRRPAPRNARPSTRTDRTVAFASAAIGLVRARKRGARKALYLWGRSLTPAGLHVPCYNSPPPERREPALEWLHRCVAVLIQSKDDYLAVRASPDGSFLASGGRRRKLPPPSLYHLRLLPICHLQMVLRCRQRLASPILRFGVVAAGAWKSVRPNEYPNWNAALGRDSRSTLCHCSVRSAITPSRNTPSKRSRRQDSSLRRREHAA